MKKLNLVATLPRLDSISLEQMREREAEKGENKEGISER